MPTKPTRKKTAKRAAPKTAKKPAARKPATRKPAAKKPAARKPAAKKPAAKKPAARKPAAKKPAAKKPAAKKPVARKAATPRPRTRAGMATVELAQALAGFAVEKKARALRILDIRGLSDYCDLLVLMTATSNRHAFALADYLQSEARKLHEKPIGIEGMEGGQWILLDHADVIVHVFTEEARLLYDLDGLWADARSLPVPDSGK